MNILTKAFWAYSLERAIKTVAQAAIAAIGTGALGIIGLDWLTIVSVSALAGVISILTSIVGYTPAGVITEATE
jgi:hypothetical protein